MNVRFLFRKRGQETGLLVVLAAMVVAMAIASPFFLKPDNLFNVLRGMSTIGIVAIGMTMVVVTGGIDLSVGSLLAVTGMLAARLMFEGIHPALAVTAGLGFGLFLGAVNGMIITKVGVNAFIVTLGMLSIGRGLTVLLATGVKGTVASNIPVTNEAVCFLGGGYIGPVPFSVIEMGVLVSLAVYFLANTVLGRQIYAVGSNLEAARLSGVNVDRVRIFVYTLTGGLCGFAGIMSAGLLSTAATNAGEGSELDVIAAVVIGGASLSGGVGTVTGTVIGAAIMAVLKNAFVLLHMPSYAQTLSIGVVIILAVAFDRLRRARG